MATSPNKCNALSEQNQLSVRSVGSFHNHEPIHMAQLLANRSIIQEHELTQRTVRSVIELMDVFEEKNQNAIELAWKDLMVYSPDGRTLVHNASGQIKASFLAIMGPSGSGKTTLLNTLARRTGNVQSQGHMIIDGKDYSLSDLKQISGYVMQDDLLNGNLTVEETLYYTVELRVPSDVTTEQKKQRIEDVIKRLGLTKCRKTIVGTPDIKGISGGERKRLCVAMELLTQPRLLFLDEPTSGLDSVSALSLCRTLKDLAHSGECTVVTTIHQPQSKIFELFDDLILLKSGRIVYYGECLKVADFLSENGYPCPPLVNVADHMLDAIQPPLEEQGLDDGKELDDKFVMERTVVDIDERKAVYAKKDFVSANRATWSHQFRILLQRSFKEQFRMRSVLLTQILQNVLLSILIGTVFLRLDNSPGGLLKRSPALFFCVINQGIFGALITINSFPKERLLTLRERAAGTYFVSAYFLAKNVAEMLLQMISPVIFSCIVYFLVGLQEEVGRFFLFMLFIVLGTMAATSLALMVSALARTTDLAVTILPMALEITRLYGGFFLSPKELPKYFVWLDALSYVKYVYVGLSLNELTGLNIECTQDQLVNGVCPSSEARIAALGLDQFTIGSCIGITIAFIVICRFIAYLGIRYLKN